MKTRKANFELLRIVAMCMVVILHYLSKGGILEEAEQLHTVADYTYWGIEACSSVAVNLFFLLTGYMMWEKGFSFKRIGTLWLQTFLYAMLIPVVLLILGIFSMQDLNLYRILPYGLPILTDHYWFITVYIILYCVAPLVNHGIAQCSKKQFESILGILLLVFSVSKSVMPFQFPLDEKGYGIMWALCVYLVGAYFGKYGIPILNKKWKSLVCYLCSALLMLVWLKVCTVLGRNIEAIEQWKTASYHYNHVLNLLASIGLFTYFSLLEIKESKISQVICKISPCVLGVYLLHEHIEIRYAWVEWLGVKGNMNLGVQLLHMVISVAVIFVVGILIDYCGRTILSARKDCRKLQILYPIILALYPLRHINQGVDLMDTGYSLANYEIFAQAESSWWNIATYLAGFSGDLLRQLPWGNTLMGMNFYTSLFVSVMALSVYFVLREKIPTWMLFLGEMIAISLCWCPTVILYNYLTYFFLIIGVLLLYRALVTNATWYYILAGICLGLNIWVRFPNLVDTLLILGVWYYGFLRKTHWKEIGRQTGLCFVGYLLGYVVGLIPMLIQYGLQDYLKMFTNLAGVSGDASDYSMISMILVPLSVYGENLKWILYMALPIGAGVLYFRIWKGKLLWVNRILYCLGILILFRWFYGQGLFNINYQTYESMFSFGIVFLIGSFALYVWCLFTTHTTQEEKMGVSLLVILQLILPLGTNNHLYPVLNCMFLFVPVTSYILYRLIKSKKVCFPVAAMVVAFLLGFSIQAILFGYGFSFRGSKEYEKRTEMITGIPRLEGMYTDLERAHSLEELYGFLQGEDTSLLAYGNLPALHYYLDMDLALTTAWPDLDSYGMDEFRDSLKEIEKEEQPVIILSSNEQNFTNEEKYELLRMYMEQESYELVFSNALFKVYDTQ